MGTCKGKMPGRDMTGCGRYPPQPWHKPIEFYSCARLGQPELLDKIMKTDPYFITQDNGAGSPLHFATTYKQLDMVKSAGVNPLNIYITARVQVLDNLLTLTYAICAPHRSTSCSTWELRSIRGTTRASRPYTEQLIWRSTMATWRSTSI